jgi:ComF family protein
VAALNRVDPAATAVARALLLAAEARAADAVAFALPQRCPHCGAPALARMLLCAACHAAIPRVPFDLCARCLAAGRSPEGCTAHPDAAVNAAWLFDDRARAFVHAFKFAARPALGEAVGPDLADAVPGRPVDLLLAVPLHPWRERMRGYNQAAVLARVAARALGVPLAAGLLVRTRRTRAQARLGPRARRRNLAGAFRVTDPAQVRGRRVLVVDDVITTGATMDACLGALAAAGARPRGLALAWAQ